MFVCDLYITGSVQLAMEVSQCDTKSILICLDEWHQYARDYQRAQQKNNVCDSIVLHNDMYDGKQTLPHKSFHQHILTIFRTKLPLDCSSRIEQTWISMLSKNVVNFYTLAESKKSQNILRKTVPLLFHSITFWFVEKENEKLFMLSTKPATISIHIPLNITILFLCSFFSLFPSAFIGHLFVG